MCLASRAESKDSEAVLASSSRQSPFQRERGAQVLESSGDVAVQ